MKERNHYLDTLKW